MRLQSSLLAAILCCIAMPCLAKGTYEQAVKITEEIRKVESKTGDWHKKSLKEQLEALERARDLVVFADKAFDGPTLSDHWHCQSAAKALVIYVMDLNSLARVLQGERAVTSSNQLLLPVFDAVELGDQYRACLDSFNQR